MSAAGINRGLASTLLSVLTSRASTLARNLLVRSATISTKLSRQDQRKIFPSIHQITAFTTKRSKMASTSIPVASLGANPEVAKQIKELLLPEYDLVHMCLSLESASTEFTEILSGNLEVAPSSGIGSNVDKPTTERRVPRAIVLGGGVSDEDYVALKEALVKGGLKVEGDGEDVVKFVRVLRDDILALGASRPDPTVISQVIRKKLGQLGL